MNQSNETFLERVCSKCPGTQWGKSSMCRIHDMHIGKITACQQWDEYQVAQLRDHDGQVAFLDLEPALEAVQRVEQDLRDYRWMAEKVQTLQSNEEQEKQYSGAGTAQYGVEASLPKAQGVNSDVTYREAQKLLRNWERMKRYERKVKKLEEAVRSLKDERERTLAEGILDGEKLYQIAQQLNVSRTTVDTIRRSMVRNLAWALYEDEMREGLPA
ncbi:LuxR C-terminal-related transcriptional regulator [Aneurinibacillus sp. Ricciae_BoGa-3]|uniref:LuxR C-terminal-related transcriptional regulator n=1 Tax=Aneurinibacillus sp. Ricciae_BoGa-3 TaxID=3022697 RepID=UPI0023402D8C|nr:LuxR C-terminal-related transcriptional regulator [Aneurinibacillus sp. Ricciae_BoGa-3]WCK55411.1 LuxR C-terminal-related transcriptional regulator [Aneurinibacillus sp. Ricciae_BoGa-3]